MNQVHGDRVPINRDVVTELTVYITENQKFRLYGRKSNSCVWPKLVQEHLVCGLDYGEFTEPGRLEECALV